ncbi:HNH endonuclease [Halorubrum saccharovorum]|uniref:HNH endonuclease n=1 Tax=Halorubrum saccharovorum TaxID=2248 RepID=UPI00128C4A80|nr:HNH endonuclease [Halorubrum saccharovorum]
MAQSDATARWCVMATAGEPKHHCEEWLREKYINEDLTQSKIADICGVSRAAVGNQIRKHGIDTGHTPDKEDYRNEAWLRVQYWENSRSLQDIADECGVCGQTILNWMDKHEIDTRTISTACCTGDIEKLKDRQWLCEMYWEDGHSSLEIGEMIGVKSSTVTRSMRELGIPRRDYTEAATTPEVAEKLRDESWLRQVYLEEKRPVRDICGSLSIEYTTLHRWLGRHGIRYRGPPTGEDSPHWTGGEKAYGEGWSLKKRRRVRVRDLARCQDCGMTESKHVEKYGRALDVHHITPARQFDDPVERYAMSNLITLCKGCHLGKWEPMAPLRPDTGVSAD